MKNVLVIFFAFGLLLLNSQKVFSETVASPSPEPPLHVQYTLPYPGILPDNPLYILKALRDNIINFFITDPVKKSDYDLLMADKRLASARSLVDKNEYGLAITTLSKAGNYFDEAIGLAAKAKNQGEDAGPIISRLFIASEKHQEVIYQMAQKTKGQTKYELLLLENRAKNFQDNVELLKSNQ